MNSYDQQVTQWPGNRDRPLLCHMDTVSLITPIDTHKYAAWCILLFILFLPLVDLCAMLIVITITAFLIQWLSGNKVYSYVPFTGINSAPQFH